MKYLLAGQTTNRLIFEKVTSSHFPEWLKFFQDTKTSVHWVEEREPAEMACEHWYQKQVWRYENDKGGMNALIEKRSGKLIGHAGLLVQSIDKVEELEIAYSLLPEYWNQGYAIEAATECKRFAFQHNFSDSLISIISTSNTPSQKVALKNGMSIERQTLYKNNEVYIFRIYKGS